MTEEELKKKAKESYWNSDANGGLSSEKNYILGFIAGAKEMQKENEQLKAQIEKMKKCSNCNHYNRTYELCQFSLGDEDYDCRNRKWELAE